MFDPRPAFDRLGDVLAFVVALGLHVGAFIALGIGGSQHGQIESEVVSVSLNLVETSVIEDVVQGEGADQTEAAMDQAAAAATAEAAQPQPEPVAEQPQSEAPPEAEQPAAEPVVEQPKPAEAAPVVAAAATAEMTADASPRRKKSEAQKRPAEKPRAKLRPKPHKPLPARPPASRQQRGATAAAARTRGAQRGQAIGPKAQSSGSRRASPGQARAYAGLVQARIASRRPGGRGISGTVVVSFAISPSGGLRSARVSRSSGNGSLDALALSSVRGASPFPAPPAGLSPGQLSFSVPFRFR